MYSKIERVIGGPGHGVLSVYCANAGQAEHCDADCTVEVEELGNNLTTVIAQIVDTTMWFATIHGPHHHLAAFCALACMQEWAGRNRVNAVDEPVPEGEEGLHVH